MIIQPSEIGRAVQQECRDRDLHSFPTRRSSDLMNAMRQAHADGWFIVFDTLTLADDRLEAFYDNPTIRDRKSGSAGMPRPRSTLFPYTTLFRSDECNATGSC